MTHDVDVIVIGAGVAGLIAADLLVAAGRRVRVLEALVNPSEDCPIPSEHGKPDSHHEQAYGSQLSRVRSAARVSSQVLGGRPRPPVR